MLKLQNYSYYFGRVPALSGLNLSLPAGGWLSVIGPNGAGKSTLLKSLLRLNEGGRPAGAALLNGRALAEYRQKELARLVSYVPQAGGWIPPFTVEEFLRLSRYPRSSPRAPWSKDDAAALEAALSLTGLAPLATRPLGQLSGGERQKAYLAAALAQESRLMLLDEPTAFLDPRHAAELAGLLKKLKREQNLTIVVVTHDLNQALSAGGQALVLRGGRQLHFGPAQSLLQEGILEEAYAHPFSRFKHPQTGQDLVMAAEAGQSAASAQNRGQGEVEHE